MEITIAENLNPLIWPLSAEEYQLLAQNLQQNGCREPFHIWRDVLLDRFHSYQICQTFGIPFQICELHFKNWGEAIIWVCKDQLCRPNIPSGMQKYLIGKRYAAEKILAARNAVRCNQHSPIPAEGRMQNRTADPLGHEYNVCCTTIQKYGTFAAAVDRIANIDSVMRMRMLSSQIWVSYENIVALSGMSDFQIKLVIAFLHETNETHLQASDIMRIVGCAYTVKKKIASGCTQTSVKNMPTYDPNTEVLGLALTIPSWCSSIRRIQNTAELSSISEAAQDKLCASLRVLQDEISSLKHIVRKGKPNE